MEDQVPFKAYALWSGQTKPEVRRFGVEKSVVTSFHYLNAKLQDVYPGLRNKSYNVAWKDEDGDDVIISSDEEIMIALGQMHTEPIKLYIHCKDTATAEDDSKDEECEILLQAFPASAFVGPNGDNAEHFGVTCDGCDSMVVGFRYKCASCHDFDLCSKCEAAGMHPAHCMVRIPVPTMPHAIIKAALKRSRHFLKSIAVKEECTFKKHKREKSGERKHAREEYHRERRERRDCRRPRVSWLETFATYMNEFANLAGDVDCHLPKPDQPTTTTQAGQPTTQAEQPITQHEQPTIQPEQTIQPDQPTSQPAAASVCGGGTSQPLNGSEKAGPSNNGAGPKGPSFSTSGGGHQLHPTIPVITLDKLINSQNVKYLIELKQKLNYLMPLLPQEPTKPEQSVNVDIDMGRERSSVESDQSSVSSGSEPKFADSTSEKGDDWTMINKENELMDVAGAMPTAPESAPIGFNLPEEFQQRVNINVAGKSIYPPLNVGTAVLDPKDQQPAVACSQPIPVQPSQAQPTPVQPSQAQPTPVQASQAQPTQAQPKPAEVQPKPTKPHIAKALDCMLAMGFNNDSGWLTQLLDNYDGNISAVIDLLTPVPPKKK